MRNKIITFPSGLKFIYNNDKNINTTSIVISCKVGSINEGSEYYGAAHLIEHMLFKGTLRHPTSDSISKVFDEIGAYFNAYTDTYITAYVAKCQSDDYNRCISVLFDMLCCSSFVSTELDKEKNVVIEEILEDSDSISSTCIAQLNKLLYYNSDYARSVSGSIKDIKNLTRDKLFKFYKTYYKPSNMVLSINTNLNFNIIKKLLDNIEFINSKSENIKHIHKPLINILKPPRTSIKKHINGIQQTHLALGFFFPFGINDVKSTYIINLLSRYLGQTMTSIIYIALREQAGIGYSIWSSIDTKPEYSSLIVYTSFEHTKLKKSIDIIMDRISTLYNQGISLKDLKKLQNAEYKSLLMKAENPMYIADYYANNILFDNYNNPFTITKLDTDDVNKIIKKYMDPLLCKISIITK